MNERDEAVADALSFPHMADRRDIGHASSDVMYCANCGAPLVPRSWHPTRGGAGRCMDCNADVTVIFR